MKIVVLGGGNSTEREVSIRSAAAVAKNLKLAGYEIISLDPKDGLSDLDDKKDIMVFPILHGQGGEDGSLQQELELRALPYLGSDSSSSAICFDKHQTRQQLKAHGLPVANGDKVTKETYFNHELAHQPNVLKVSRGGSSIGTYIVRDPQKVDTNKIAEVFDLDTEAILEELVKGVEITIPILDSKALSVIEIVPPETGEFDYENKYNGKTKEICPPNSIDKASQNKAQKLAEETHKALKARHLSRVDMIVKPSGEIVILELNTMPGMTEQSLFPLAAKTDGIDMPDLMKTFVNLVKRDYKL